MADLAEQYARLRDGTGAVWLARDAVRVAGPDAATFLDGQLSQDLKPIEVGGAAESLLLQPQGKVVAYLRVSRVGDDEFVLDTDAGFGEAVIERLARFKLRTKADIEVVPGWRCLAIRGVRAHEVSYGVDADWPGLAGVDLLGDAVELPDDIELCSDEAYSAVRIEAGVPVMGRELTDKTIPAEAGGLVERTVSFTKGCYTGQELVARVDSRGSNVARRLCGVVVDGRDAPPAGAELHDAGGAVGALTSVAFSPGLDTPVALAYVARRVPDTADTTVQWDGGTAAAHVRPLPLV
jgi:tRNA-modifying protein YgfZ